MRTNNAYDSIRVSFDPKQKLLTVTNQTRTDKTKSSYHLSARIYKGQKQGVFTTRPFRAFFAKHIKVTTKGATTPVLVKIRDLEKATGLHSKDIEGILKKSAGSFEELISAQANLNPSIKKISKGHLNIGFGEASEAKNVIFYRNKKGKIKAFREKEELGSGAFKNVYLVSEIAQTTQKSLAYARAKDRSETAKTEAQDEFKIGGKLYDSYKRSNPSVKRASIPFLKYYSLVDQSKAHSKKTGILMEAGDTDLSYLRRLKLSDTQKGIIARELLQGMAFMHEKGLAHRDLKPNNILLKKDDTSDYHAKIADFGLSCSAEDFQESPFAGTLRYFPPEYFDDTISKKEMDAKKFDSWALGVTLFELYIGTSPSFHREIDQYDAEKTTQQAVITAMNDGSEAFKILAQNLRLDENIADVIANLMHTDFKKRWTVEEALEYLDTPATDESPPPSIEGDQQVGFFGKMRSLAGRLLGFPT